MLNNNVMISYCNCQPDRLIIEGMRALDTRISESAQSGNWEGSTILARTLRNLSERIPSENPGKISKGLDSLEKRITSKSFSGGKRSNTVFDLGVSITESNDNDNCQQSSKKTISEHSLSENSSSNNSDADTVVSMFDDSAVSSASNSTIEIYNNVSDDDSSSMQIDDRYDDESEDVSDIET